MLLSRLGHNKPSIIRRKLWACYIEVKNRIIAHSKQVALLLQRGRAMLCVRQ